MGVYQFGYKDSWDGHRFDHLPRTKHLLGISSFFDVFRLPHVESHIQRDLPKALNSNLTYPARAPFSKTNTRSVLVLFPLAVAEKTDSSESIEAPLVRIPGATAEVGI